MITNIGFVTAGFGLGWWACSILMAHRARCRYAKYDCQLEEMRIEVQGLRAKDASPVEAQTNDTVSHRFDL
jgi:hypothetical protein